MEICHSNNGKDMVVEFAIFHIYCVFFIAHARNGRISIFGLKYDITIVFLDPDVF